MQLCYVQAQVYWCEESFICRNSGRNTDNMEGGRVVVEFG